MKINIFRRRGHLVVLQVCCLEQQLIRAQSQLVDTGREKEKFLHQAAELQPRLHQVEVLQKKNQTHTCDHADLYKDKRWLLSFWNALTTQRNLSVTVFFFLWKSCKQRSWWNYVFIPCSNCSVSACLTYLIHDLLSRVPMISAVISRRTWGSWAES